MGPGTFDDAGIAAEATLVRRAQAGDANAYGDLVTRHQQAVFRVASILLGSAADAEDAAQEAFVHAYLALGRFRADELFRPWLLAITGNEARNRRRARGRREGLLNRAVDAVRGQLEVAPAPEQATLAIETRTEVHDALATLCEEERLVVTCR